MNMNKILAEVKKLIVSDILLISENNQVSPIVAVEVTEKPKL